MNATDSFKSKFVRSAAPAALAMAFIGAGFVACGGGKFDNCEAHRNCPGGDGPSDEGGAGGVSGLGGSGGSGDGFGTAGELSSGEEAGAGGAGTFGGRPGFEVPPGSETTLPPPGGMSEMAGGAGGDTSTPEDTDPQPVACGEGGSIDDPKTRPGYEAEPDPQVAELVGKMSQDSKFKQLYGIAVPSSKTAGIWRDIERSEDVPSGTGKTIRGYRYRNAGRAVNLVAGQHDRTSDGKTDYSTVFPAQSARAASWDVNLEYDVGVALGDETMASKNTMLLAPCMNIIRHPYWGRTQESYSEDMFHTGRLASALTAGIQTHVIACPKHFAANNIEDGRYDQNAVMNEQTLREIYGRHFEMVVQDGDAGCILASYNKINDKKSTQNKHLLTDILRGPVELGGMGFRGLVLTDWWAMPGGNNGPADTGTAQRQAAEAVKAGTDIEVPWNYNYSQLGQLLSSKMITQADIDASVSRVLEQKFRFGHAFTDQPYGLGTATTSLSGVSITGNEAHLALAEEAVIRSAVLLLNGTATPPVPVLPIAPEVKTIAVLAPDITVSVSFDADIQPGTETMNMATMVNTGDRGSSRGNHDPAKAIAIDKGLTQLGMTKGVTVTAGKTAQAGMAADLIVVMVGLTAGDEGEEYSIQSRGDRASLDLPGTQNQFVNSVLSLNKPTVIIIQSGSFVNVPWRSHANQRQATIWAGYSGQRSGPAFAKLLFGDRNFSGKMAMAWAKQAELPVFKETASKTTMGYYFGYREYDRRKAAGMPVNLEFPFGHGLSYTTFEYLGGSVPCSEVKPTTIIETTVDVRNTGTQDGEEVIMLFVKPPPKPADVTGDRPVKELKGFYKVSLEAGEGKRVMIPLKIQDLRRWEGTETGKWVLDPGMYTVLAGPNNDDANLKTIGSFTLPPG